MEIEVYQIIFIFIFAFLASNDALITGILNQQVITGAIIGFIMGDVTVGLTIGATMQLMRLGVAAFGGATIPDYFTGTVLGTVFAITTGQGAEYGIGLGVPVALLMIQLDILGRFCNVFILHRIDWAIEKMKLGYISPLVLSGSLIWGLTRAVPIVLMLLVGDSIITTINEAIPVFIMDGLKTAGRVLPVVGIAVLLRYMPTKTYFPYLLIGFFFTAFLKVPIIGIALLGLIVAIFIYRRGVEQHTHQGVDASPTLTTYEGGVNEDEL